MSNFNVKHPELQEGEMWLTNISPNIYYENNPEILEGTALMIVKHPDSALEENFNKVGWKTKRLGKTAYDPYGRTNNQRPVFVKRKELIDAGMLKENQKKIF